MKHIFYRENSSLSTGAVQILLDMGNGTIGVVEGYHHLGDRWQMLSVKEERGRYYVTLGDKEYPIFFPNMTLQRGDSLLGQWNLENDYVGQDEIVIINHFPYRGTWENKEGVYNEHQ